MFLVANARSQAVEERTVYEMNNSVEESEGQAGMVLVLVLVLLKLSARNLGQASHYDRIAPYKTLLILKQGNGRLLNPTCYPVVHANRRRLICMKRIAHTQISSITLLTSPFNSFHTMPPTAADMHVPLGASVDPPKGWRHLAGLELWLTRLVGPGGMDRRACTWRSKWCAGGRHRVS